MRQKAPLIPREVLFGNPQRAAVRLSPGGQYISFLAPREGVLNVWVAPVDQPEAAEPVTFDEGRGIRSYFWAYNSEQIIYLKDKDGDENWRAYAVDVESKEEIDLTPLEGVRAQIQEVSLEYPNEILVGLNDRDERLHDIYRVNLRTGERELVMKNEEGFAGYVTDDDFHMRFATQFQPDGSYVYMQRSSDGWEEFLTVPADDTMNTYFAGFDKSGEKAYWVESRGRNTSALTVLDLETGEQKLLAEDPQADISGVMQHPTEKTIEAAYFDYDRRRFQILDESIKEDIEKLEELSKGELMVTDRTTDDRTWVAAYIQDDGPVEYYLWDRDQQKGTFLFTNRPELEGLPLSPMMPVIIESSDGLNLVSYLTLPHGTRVDGKGFPVYPLPMVLLVHGGPWARDSWGYDAQHQLLANRGYAVLSVNFRGSTGFGKDFINAANKEWGRKMHDDLIDAVNWAVDRGVAQKQKVAIMGGSYGGYATLAGLTFTPEVFACGVDIVGPSNLVTLLNSIPPYWERSIEMFATRVGDHRTEEGRELLESRSPLNYVEKIEDPLLIAQGANDPRVKQSEADQIVEAMQKKSIPVTYVLYPDEGHGFARPENRISFMAVTEAFLAENLGGRYEEIGDAFDNASITVPTGAADVPGLEEKLGTEKAAE